MLDLVILPKLRSFYLRKKADGSVDYDDYAAQCRKFAVEKLNLPPAQWSKVHLPAFISLDNASIHEWARKLCFRPRQPEAKLRPYLGECFERDFNMPAHMSEQFQVFPARPGSGPDGSSAVQGVGQFLGPVASARAGAEARMSAATMRKHITDHDKARECSWVQDQLHALSLSKPGMICLVPQQVMPLAEVTPDIHCVIEHLVGTVKRFVHDRLLDFDVPDEALDKGVTYQGWLEEAVRERGNGERGRHHVRRSIAKQKCICEILRTPHGEEIEVEFLFDSTNNAGNRRTKHTVRGTGGAWIADSKWT